MNILSGSRIFQVADNIKSYDWKPFIIRSGQAKRLFLLDTILLACIASWFIKNVKFPYYIPVLFLGIFLDCISFLGCIGFLIGITSGNNSTGIKPWLTKPFFEISMLGVKNDSNYSYKK